jgi:hypothetical protein
MYSDGRSLAQDENAKGEFVHPRAHFITIITMTIAARWSNFAFSIYDIQ